MKDIQTLLFAALFGVALVLPGNVSAQSTKQGVATVVRIQGEARYSTGDNVWHPLVAGKVLGAGAVVQTAVNSTVDLVLGEVPINLSYPSSTTLPSGLSTAPDPNVRSYVVYNPKVNQNVIRLFSDTVLAIDKLNISDTGLDAVGDTELDLRAGKIFGNVRKLSAMSQFEVKIPNGVAGIRGTAFLISADGSVSVLKGSVIVSVLANGQTTTQEVGTGQMFSPGNGSPVSIPPGILSSLGAFFNATGFSSSQEFHFVDSAAKSYVSPTCGKQK
ncbi:MAG TPA: FecR domain-containing protein [Verrucomicrobiae bacterium]|nr:FecR domain-containing protein [Verrucomicrobiae bacterium]